MLNSRTIAILTDFGHVDPFVGVLKGVIAGLAPGTRVIDITHEVPPGDIFRGAVTLWQSVDHFPRGTTFLAIVDPGVGTDRPAIVMRTPGRIFVGPDNGIFSFAACQVEEAYQITNYLWNPERISSTFHGRDIFAPVAALCSLGQPPESFGPPVANPRRLHPPSLEILPPNEIEGEILFPDRFGNLLTSIGRVTWLDGRLKFQSWLDHSRTADLDRQPLRLVLPDGRGLPLVRTFADLSNNQVGGLVGSSGLIEIVANHGNAAELIGLSRGERVRLAASPGDHDG